jgi:ferritin
VKLVGLNIIGVDIMLNEKMLIELNKQINAEFYSAYLYLSMSASMEAHSLKGFANWFRVQWQEELSHALKLFDYVTERGGEIKLDSIETPKIYWISPLEIFIDTYTHEKKVTGMINDLMEVAQMEKDFATQQMLQWFVKEQVEEESNASELVEKLKMVGEDKRGLLELDRELLGRVFTDETQQSK